MDKNRKSQATGSRVCCCSMPSAPTWKDQDTSLPVLHNLSEFLSKTRNVFLGRFHSLSPSLVTPSPDVLATAQHQLVPFTSNFLRRRRGPGGGGETRAKEEGKEEDYLFFRLKGIKRLIHIVNAQVSIAILTFSQLKALNFLLFSS